METFASFLFAALLAGQASAPADPPRRPADIEIKLPNGGALIVTGDESMAPRPGQAPIPYPETATVYHKCLHDQVSKAVDSKMSAAAFRARLAKSCLEEEERFRPDGVRMIMLVEGRTAAEAQAQLERTLEFSRQLMIMEIEGRAPRP